MSIFGTFVDRQLGTRVGDGVSGVALTTMAHSLPATNPEIFLVGMRSVQAVGVQSAIGLLGLRGNASLNTVGFAISSSASTPTIEFEGVAAVLHSIIR